MAGIELATSAWKAGVLPLNYIRIHASNFCLLYAVTKYTSDRDIVKDLFLKNREDVYNSFIFLEFAIAVIHFDAI